MVDKMTKEELSRRQEIMDFLSENVFSPILNSTSASDTLKNGVRYTTMRLKNLNSEGMIKYYWSAIVGTDKSIEFAKQMRDEGFARFESEDVLQEFRSRFNAWIF